MCYLFGIVNCTGENFCFTHVATSVQKTRTEADPERKSPTTEAFLWKRLISQGLSTLKKTAVVQLQH